jgi:hypothetical protein
MAGPAVNETVIGLDGRVYLCVKRGRNIHGQLITTLIPVEPPRPRTTDDVFTPGTRWVTYDRI